jgi:hypothetical protein
MSFRVGILFHAFATMVAHKMFLVYCYCSLQSAIFQFYCSFFLGLNVTTPQDTETKYIRVREGKGGGRGGQQYVTIGYKKFNKNVVGSGITCHSASIPAPLRCLNI